MLATVLATPGVVISSLPTSPQIRKCLPANRMAGDSQGRRRSFDYWDDCPAGMASSDREVVVFGLHEFGGRLEHTGGDGKIRSLLDQDEGAGETVGGVTVEDDRSGGAQADFADVVYGQFVRFRFGLEGRDVDAVLDVGDDRLHGLGGVFEKIFPVALQRALV